MKSFFSLLSRLGVEGRADPASRTVLLPGREELERLACFFGQPLHSLAAGFLACGWEFRLKLEEKEGDAA